MTSSGSVGAGVSLRPCGSNIDPDEIWSDARIGEVVFVPGTRQPPTGGGVVVLPDVRTDVRRQEETQKEPAKVNPIVGICLAKAVLGLIPILQGAPVIRSQVCAIRYAVILSGTDVQKQTDHIRDAMVVRGRSLWDLSNASSSPSLFGKWFAFEGLQYSKPKPRGWMRTARAQPRCPTPRPPGPSNEKQDCDEYPFASTTGGGEDSFLSASQGVRDEWLQLIPASQNRSFGSKLGLFYRNSDCKIDTTYQELFDPGDDIPLETGNDPKIGSFLVVAQNVLPTFSLCDS